MPGILTGFARSTTFVIEHTNTQILNAAAAGESVIRVVAILLPGEEYPATPCCSTEEKLDPPSGGSGGTYLWRRYIHQAVPCAPTRDSRSAKSPAHN